MSHMLLLANSSLEHGSQGWDREGGVIHKKSVPLQLNFSGTLSVYLEGGGGMSEYPLQMVVRATTCPPPSQRDRIDGSLMNPGGPKQRMEGLLKNSACWT